MWFRNLMKVQDNDRVNIKAETNKYLVLTLIKGKIQPGK